MKIARHRVSDAPFVAAHASGGEMKPTLIILHDTAGRLDAGSSVNWFKSEDCTASAHIVVERDGTIIQMVPFDRKAFHAGISEFKDRRFCNSFSIGIEIVNPGKCDKDGRAWFHKISKDPKKWQKGFPVSELKRAKTKEHGAGYWMDYTPEQIEAVTELCRALIQAYPSIEDISAHFVVSPGRKIDVNPLFPLDEVREAAFRVRGEADVVALEPIAPEPARMGLSAIVSDSSFAKVNDLADKGSRIAGWIRSVKRWFWGGTITTTTALASLDTRNGSTNVFAELVRDHPLLSMGVVVGVTAIVVYVAIKLVEKYLITAATDGRYQPRGK